MLISDFVIVGSKVGEVIITLKANGYVVEIKGKGWDIICATQRDEVRYWKSFDTLIKHLKQAGFSGTVLIPTLK